LRPEDTVEHASEVFSRHVFHHLPVKKAAGQLVGLVTDRDILRLLAGGADADSLRVEDIMARRVLTATPETSLREVARVMVAESINCLPIVDKQQRLAGILTAADILRYLVNRTAINLWI
jgi:CBS domain-containing protein